MFTVYFKPIFKLTDENSFVEHLDNSVFYLMFLVQTCVI